MNDPKDPLLLDHEADGIKELDNNLPRWWVWLFYLCIIFAFGYMGYYHVMKAGDLQIAEYEKEWKRGEEIKSAALAKFESSMGTLTPSKDPAMLATDVAEYLVRRGVPFRECHGIVAGLVRDAVTSGRQLSDFSPDELKAHSEHLDAGVAEVLQRSSWLESKVSEGGTALERVREQLELARGLLAG